MTSNPAVTRFRRSHVAIRSFGRCGESSPDVRATSASIFDAMNVFTTSSTISGPSTSIRVATDLSDSFSVFIVRVRRSFAARSRRFRTFERRQSFFYINGDVSRSWRTRASPRKRLERHRPRIRPYTCNQQLVFCFLKGHVSLAPPKVL